VKIGVDVLGGDFAPQAVLEGVSLMLKDLPENAGLVLFGNEQDIAAHPCSTHPRVSIHHAPEKVLMNDHPTRVLSTKPDSSIVRGMYAIKNNEINGFCSAGNTGAMLVSSLYIVNAIPGVIRPAIASVLPKISGGTGLIIDVGANADCKPDVLYQFAVMGSWYSQHVLNVKNPKVALLNIGEEPEKGNLLAQSAYRLMQDTTDFNFVGNVEGRNLFSDFCDVIVCDGFTGNVVLKQAESMYNILLQRGLRDDFLDRFNYEMYGGTPILGVNAPVVIGHGISSPLAIRNMIFHTLDVVKADLKNHFENLFKK